MLVSGLRRYHWVQTSPIARGNGCFASTLIRTHPDDFCNRQNLALGIGLPADVDGVSRSMVE